MIIVPDNPAVLSRARVRGGSVSVEHQGNASIAIRDAASGGGGGGGEPTPPDGFGLVVDGDGKYLVNSDGAYWISELT